MEEKLAFCFFAEFLINPDCINFNSIVSVRYDFIFPESKSKYIFNLILITASLSEFLKLYIINILKIHYEKNCMYR